MNWRAHKKPHKKKKTMKQNSEIDLNTLVSEEYEFVIGIDEVGIGAIVGPIVISGAVVPWGFKNPGFKDSKRFTTEKARESGASFAKSNVLRHILFTVTQDRIEEIGAGPAVSEGQRFVVYTLLQEFQNSLIVVDGNKLISGFPRKNQLAIVKADARVPVVSAASIIAKQDRDKTMIEIGHLEEYDVFRFYKNKGYATKNHMEVLEVYGPTKYHRRNVQKVIELEEKLGRFEENEL